MNSLVSSINKGAQAFVSGPRGVERALEKNVGSMIRRNVLRPHETPDGDGAAGS